MLTKLSNGLPYLFSPRLRASAVKNPVAKNMGLLLFVVLCLTACSSTSPKHSAAPKPTPETVLLTYHVKPGKEAEMQDVLARAWVIYRKEHLVFAQPHVILRGKEGKNTRLVEAFTWVSHEAPDHAPESVKSIWNEMQSLCEPRDGHGGLEGGEVEMIAP